MADFKSIEEANKEYEELEADFNKTKKLSDDKEIEITALKEESAKFKKELEEAKKELTEVKKMNYTLVNRLDLAGGNKETDESLIAEMMGWKSEK